MFSSVDKDPRPYLKVEIFGVDFFGLLDSGASQTVIGKAGWDKLLNFGLSMETCKNSIRVANGGQCDVLGVVDLPIRLNEKIRVIRTWVVLDIEAEIIFGIDFWRDMDIVSDFSDSSWKFKNELKMSPNLGCARGVKHGKSHVVPDALSRAIALISVTDTSLDNWYIRLKRNIIEHPNKYPKFKLRDGNIYKFVNFGHPTLDERDDWKLVVPKTLRRDVLHECHDDPSAGHLGIFKTQKRITNCYFWPGMGADIARYVRACEVCKAQKPEQRRPYVQERLRKTYGEVAQRYNRLRRRPVTLSIGQVVWKRNYTLSDAAEYYASKLAPKFIKCRVLKRLSTNVYELADFGTGRSLGTWHIKDIKLN
ncbi:hypothetical protein NQ317_009037 [Molorchus minor]|uniref:RNA-directed DNA polymerase n=1 Tax=Molorchus minor TaxID=1323400 RepID=A0ABQ9ISG7_9CUCU|nr:hypothetical protein NQ317_009037 [Molorchus minor]